METKRQISHAKRRSYGGYSPDDMTTQSDTGMTYCGVIVGQGSVCPDLALEPSTQKIFKDYSRNKYLWTTWLPTHTVGIEQDFAFPEETIASMSLWPEVLHYSEPDKFWRGVFSPHYRRKILFLQEVEFKTADLPKWHPKVFIDRRTLERENI
jgi:hypothetical protein